MYRSTSLSLLLPNLSLSLSLITLSLKIEGEEKPRHLTPSMPAPNLSPSPLRSSGTTRRTPQQRMALPLRGGGWPPLAVALLLLLLCVARASLETESAGAGDPSAPERAVREALRAHGLPIGLLPRGAREFRIDGEGRFEVRLDGACSARFENEVRYEANVTGTLTYGQIGALSGVTAQELFLWFPVKGISVEDPSSGLIFFDVGVVRKQFPLSLFEIPPDCKVGPPPAGNLHEAREMALAVEKSKSGKLRYHLDLDAAQRTATL